MNCYNSTPNFFFKYKLNSGGAALHLGMYFNKITFVSIKKGNAPHYKTEQQNRTKGVLTLGHLKQTSVF